MRVFVSYRRSDSKDAAARLAERLREMPGIREVFFDVETIEPGADFVKKINGAIDRCDAIFVLIGDGWSGASIEGGSPRIHASGDFVRLEVESALNRNKRILPVLVHGANMPSPESLPDSIRPIAFLNAMRVHHETFGQDVERLADALFERGGGGSWRRFFRRRPILSMALKMALGLVLGTVSLLLVAGLHGAGTGRALDETLGASGAWFLIWAFPTVGALIPLIRRLL